MRAPRNVTELLAATGVADRPELFCFWGHRARSAAPGRWILSQWWSAPFTASGQAYPTAEHYMMAGKARLFGDTETAKNICATDDPTQARELGRQVSGFAEDTWREHRFDLVLTGNLAKFGQHPELGRFLLGTGDAVLVEASPVDRVWGVGLVADDPRVRDPAKWRGQNLLGFVLMEVRALLREQS